MRRTVRMTLELLIALLTFFAAAMYLGRLLVADLTRTPVFIDGAIHPGFLMIACLAYCAFSFSRFIITAQQKES